MLDSQVRRLQEAYPAIFLACHRQHIRSDDSGKSMTEHQASVLDHLDARQPVTLSKLAEHLGVSRSTMSITVSRLVRGGYIMRRKSTLDARSVALTLTRAGMRVKNENAVLHPELVRAIFRRMQRRKLDISSHTVCRWHHGPHYRRWRSLQSHLSLRLTFHSGANSYA
jgi:MarR family transcriptional regulator, organic hydroperoxide resistance regulator